jgi:hypothetical protein
MATVPPVVLPPWVVERDRYNIKLPHIDTLLAIADKGRTPRRRIGLSIGPVPSGLYKTARDTITCDVPKLTVPTPYDCNTMSLLFSPFRADRRCLNLCIFILFSRV